jgi:hypothetical protein
MRLVFVPATMQASLARVNDAFSPALKTAHSSRGKIL